MSHSLVRSLRRSALVCFALLAEGASAQDVDGGVPLMAVDAGTPEPSASPAATAAPEPAPAVEIAAPRVAMTASGFVQFDAVLLDDSSSGINEQMFVLRRGRLRLAGDQGIVSASIEIDGNTARGPQVRVISAEASARWQPTDAPPLVMLTGGLIRTPFGFDVRQLVRQRLFLEPSLVARALFPGDYDVGVRLMGALGFFRYEVGAMNGEPVGTRSFPGQDPNRAKDWVGRLAVAFGETGGLGFELGASGLEGRGFHAATGGERSQDFRRFALGADLRAFVKSARLGELVFIGEVIRGFNMDRAFVVADPIALGRDLRELGWTAALTHELPFGLVWGARYELYAPDTQAAPWPAPRATNLAGVIGYRLRPYARVLLQLDHAMGTLAPFGTGLVAHRPSGSLVLRAEVGF